MALSIARMGHCARLFFFMTDVHIDSLIFHASILMDIYKCLQAIWLSMYVDQGYLVIYRHGTLQGSEKKHWSGWPSFKIEEKKKSNDPDEVK